jgi:hypothetical protein
MGRYRHHCLNAAGSRRRNFPIEAPVCLREVPGITMSALPALTLWCLQQHEPLSASMSATGSELSVPRVRATASNGWAAQLCRSPSSSGRSFPAVEQSVRRRRREQGPAHRPAVRSRSIAIRSRHFSSAIGPRSTSAPPLGGYSLPAARPNAVQRPRCGGIRCPQSADRLALASPGQIRRC